MRKSKKKKKEHPERAPLVLELADILQTLEVCTSVVTVRACTKLLLFMLAQEIQEDGSGHWWGCGTPSAAS